MTVGAIGASVEDGRRDRTDHVGLESIDAISPGCELDEEARLV